MFLVCLSQEDFPQKLPFTITCEIVAMKGYKNYYVSSASEIKYIFNIKTRSSRAFDTSFIISILFQQIMGQNATSMFQVFSGARA